MIYKTVPIPTFSFTDVPESEAEEVVQMFFMSPYHITYNIDMAKNHIKQLLYNQESAQDKIVIISYLINKLTERVFTLPEPRSSMEKSVREREATPTYKLLSHFLYRLIENEGIAVPQDLFNHDDYKAAQECLHRIDEIIEQLKIETPNEANNLSIVQEEVKKNGKLLWLGKEKWIELVMGTILKVGIEKGIFPLLVKLFSNIQSVVTTLLLSQHN